MPAFEMRWRDTLFASWPVDPAVVAPRIPDRLEVDTFEGTAYLSVVPFAIRNIRPDGWPAAVGLSTPELNLRTYVTCDGAPGIYFFSLDADDLLGVVGARLWNHLPYYYADIDYARSRGSDDGVRFRSRRTTPGARSVRFDATYGGSGDRYQPEEGTLDHFLTERYRYFAEGPDGTIRYATISHDSWWLRPATWEVRENTLFEANGFEQPAGDPHLRYGEPVAVHASSVTRW